MKTWPFALIAIVGAGWWCARGAPSSPRTAPALAIEPVDGALAPGARRRYHLDTRRELSLAGDTRTAVELGATWSETVVSHEPGRRWLHVELADVTITPAARLPRDFFVVCADDGRVVEVGFDPEVTAAARGLLTALATELQVTAPAGGGDRWRVDELTENGRAVSVYVRAGRHLDKRRTEIAPDGGLSADVLASQTSIAVDAAGRRERIELEEQVRYRGPSGVGFEASTRTRLTLLGRDAIGARVRELAARRARLELGRGRGPTPTRPDQHDRQLLGDATYGELIDELGGLAGEPDGARRRARLAARLRALFALDDDAVADAGTTLLAGASPDAITMLTGALSAAGTEASAALLADLAGSADTPARVRGAAVLQLGLSERVTAEGTAALLGALDGDDPALARIAMLAVGSTARRSTPPVRDELVERLLHLETDAASEPDRVHALTALGNTGDARVLAPLGRALTVGTTAERIAAIGGLRLVDDPRVEALLARALVDPDRAVRARAEAVRRARHRRS